MTAVRNRTPGNNPETRIHCDWVSGRGAYCRTRPVTDWDAKDARRVARALGWVRVDGKDYCLQHSGSPLADAIRQAEIEALRAAAREERLDSASRAAILRRADRIAQDAYA